MKKIESDVTVKTEICVKSYKHFALVNYDSRVVIYKRRGLIRLATDKIVSTTI